MTEKKEYIERGALRSTLDGLKLRYVQSDNLIGKTVIAVIEGFINLLERETAADVVEVVRCKDCIFKHKGRCLRDVPYCRDNEYCAVGQRKAVSRNDR